jgi:hypothetical protein
MKQNMKQWANKVEKWSRKFPEAIEAAFNQASPELIAKVQYGYLSGRVLGVQTGDLRASIKTIIKKDNRVNMLVGSDHTRNGFSYGRHWFDKGRDFLNPAIKDTMPRITKLIANEITKSYEEIK